MRSISDELKRKYFTHRGHHYEIDQDIRKAVEYRVLDLVCDDYEANGAGMMDIILCRNVLIYFDGPTIKRIATRLLQSLAPRGWLILSASDPVLVDVVPCQAIATGAGLAYRRPDATKVSIALPNVMPSPQPMPEPVPAPAPAAPPVRAEKPALRTPRPAARVVSEAADAATASEDAYRNGDYARAASAARRAIDAGRATESLWLVFVRSLGDLGRLDEAGEACAAALEQFPVSSALLTLHATLLLEAGHATEAENAAKRALYINRRAPMTHMVLGDALLRTGNPVEARRSFANAASLLDGVPPEQVIEESGGETAGRLRTLATFRARDASLGDGEM
jgi:chemotaxis protein methyltransferase CheR